MFIKQDEIFWGLDRSFVGEIFEGADKMVCEPGDVLFAKGGPALDYYILVKGRIKIENEEAGRVVYTVNHAGESFGWSSLVGREKYSASAVCSEESRLMRLSKDHILKTCARHPESGMQFFQHLAGLLGNRLIDSYRMLISDSQADMSPTSGTGQVMETVEMTS